MGTLNIINRETLIFSDRIQAGRMLADSLSRLNNPQDMLVLGIPRGGVVLAHQIARGTGGSLDVVLTRKLGAPYNPELAIGAISENGNLYLNDELISSLRVNSEYIKQIRQEQLAEIAARHKLYRNVLDKVSLEGKTVILTDDGIATGATMQASIWAAKAEKPKKIILAVPVASLESVRKLALEVDETICLSTPPVFYAIGQFYREFDQVSDKQVLEILGKYKTKGS